MGRRTVVVSLVAAAVVTGAVVLVGGTTRPVPDPAPEPEVSAPASLPTTLAAYDMTGVAAIRGPFCDRVSPTGIEHALGDVPADGEEWENGDLERLPDGSRDRVQEFGCRWTGADGTHATAWVFAPPVRRADAVDLAVSMAGKEYGARCRAPEESADFGAPGETVVCALDVGTTELRYAGLFGDAWLTCTLSAPGEPADLAERSSEWCVNVVEAARS